MERNLKIGDQAAQTATQSSRPSPVGQSSPFTVILDMLFLCLKNWKWFVLSLGITLGAAYYLIKSTPDLYYRSASIMIKGDEQQTAINSALKGLGIDQTSPSVNNEILSLKTTDVASEIVKRLDLEISYYQPGPFHDRLVYGSELPIKATFDNINDHETIDFNIKVKGDSTFAISGMVYNGAQQSAKAEGRFGQPVNLPCGPVTITATAAYKGGETSNLIVKRSDRHATISKVQSKIQASLADKNSTLISIGYTDFSPQRADDILNTLVTVYNENWVKDRNRITISTNEFIKDRLAIIEEELGDVENDISTYKAEHLMTSPQQEASLAVNRADAAEQQSYALDNQIYMTKYVKSYLTDGMHDHQLLPTHTGIHNSSIETQINEYNRVLLQRNQHMANSSEQNPLVMDLDQQLEIQRQNIVMSLDNELEMLGTQKRTVASTHSRAVSKIASNPEQTTYLLSVERQQKVKESLYLYLLQKREENELSQAFTAYNSRLIEPPHGSWVPIEPVPKRTYTLALILGLALPFGIIVLKEMFNTTVRGRKDLEHSRLPFVGEIPLEKASARKAAKIRKKTERERNKSRNRAKAYKAPNPELLVSAKNRNAINEAFRVVRSNLEFVLGFESSHKVIMLTSMNPGSGKTFISANLAESIALKGKRVLAIDLDLRKRSLSKYIGNPRKGVSNYLSGQVSDYHECIMHFEHYDVLPCGSLPPNPSELLYTERFKSMMETVRQEYDFVITDCPPVEVVADASIINRYVDMTLFIVRAHLMDRSFLDDIERWYDEHRYHNLSLLLNGTTEGFSHYGNSRYGYRYGYRYGNYGYGYGNNEIPDEEVEAEA